MEKAFLTEVFEIGEVDEWDGKCSPERCFDVGEKFVLFLGALV